MTFNVMLNFEPGVKRGISKGLRFLSDNQQTFYCKQFFLKEIWLDLENIAQLNAI